MPPIAITHTNSSSATNSAQSAPNVSDTMKKSIVQIGCGVVGHAYARAFAESGHKVLGIEASRTRMEEVSSFYRTRHVSDNLSNENNIDFILLSINTPLDESTGALSMRHLWSSLDNVVTLLHVNPNALVVVRSTVTLGFCAAYRSALARKLLELRQQQQQKQQREQQYHHHHQDSLSFAVPRLCFQPEFLRAKSALSDALTPWHVVLGADSPSEIGDYAQFQATYVHESRISYCTIDEAEVMKIFHNSFNAAKISYFNHAAMLIDRVNQRDDKSIDAAATFKLISKTCEGLLNPMYGLTPGHAYYGSCLPKDSAELAHMEKSLDLECNLFAQVVNVNSVVMRSDVAQVLHGDNHVDSEFFHNATARNPLPDSFSKRNDNALSMLSLTDADADKVSDSSVDSS